MEEPVNKVVLIGDYGVGKTSLFMRFKNPNDFVEVDSQTRREAEHTKSWTDESGLHSMTMFDTAGMERYEATVPPTYFRNAKAVMFVYSVSESATIDSVPHWSQSVTPVRLGTHAEKMVRVLVGNKVDATCNVSSNRGRNTADACNCDLFFEVSAKTGEGVSEMFTALAVEIERSNVVSKTGTASMHEPKKDCCTLS